MSIAIASFKFVTYVFVKELIYSLYFVCKVREMKELILPHKVLERFDR